MVLSGRGREIKSSVGRAVGLSEHVDPVGLEGLLQSSGGNKISAIEKSFLYPPLLEKNDVESLLHILKLIVGRYIRYG